MIRTAFSFVVLAVAAAFCAGCRQPSTLIGVFPRTTGTLLWEAFHQGLADMPGGRNIYWNGPSDEADTAGQLDLAGAYRTKRYRGIIFAPIDTMASRSLILEATEAHIPVVVVDDVQGLRPGRYLSYVSSDERAAGRMAAEKVAELLHGRGSIAIVGITGRLASATLREASFEDAMQQIAPGIEIRFRRLGDSNLTHQQQIVQSIIASPEHVNAIVALSSSSTRGAFYAKIAAVRKSSIRIVGFDQDLLTPLQLGDIDAIIAQNTRELGRQAMLNLDKQMRGEATQGYTTVAPLLITRENLRSADLLPLYTPGPAWSGQ